MNSCYKKSSLTTLLFPKTPFYDEKHCYDLKPMSNNIMGIRIASKVVVIIDSYNSYSYNCLTPNYQFY